MIRFATWWLDAEPLFFAGAGLTAELAREHALAALIEAEEPRDDAGALASVDAGFPIWVELPAVQARAFLEALDLSADEIEQSGVILNMSTLHTIQANTTFGV